MARTYDELVGAMKAAGMYNPVLDAVAKTNPGAIEALLPAVTVAAKEMAKEAIGPSLDTIRTAIKALETAVSNTSDDLKAGREVGTVQATAIANSCNAVNAEARKAIAAITGKAPRTTTSSGGTKRSPEEVKAALGADALVERDRKNLYNNMSGALQRTLKVSSLADAYAASPKLPQNVWTHCAAHGVDIPANSRALFEAWCKADSKVNAAWAAGQSARKSSAA